jgi:uncharacterized protein
MKLLTNEITIIQQTADYVKKEFSGDSSGHDWWHIYRVWKTAITICEREGGRMFVVQLAALLHDLDDWKLHPSASSEPERAMAWMRMLAVDESVMVEVREIIVRLSYKGAGVPDVMQGLEGQIVQDADRLDAIGAVGIARAFAYGGHKGRLLYDPAEAPALHQNFEQYKNNQSSTINHFYEKLLLLRERINTRTARQIADQRHAVMEAYLAQFMREWEGTDLESQS